MANNVRLITERVEDLVGPVLDEMDYDLVDVEYLSSHGRWVLRLYIDKDGGVTVGDCASVSREIGDLIDVKEIIEHEYVLEVSSPGLNRPLKKERDFINATGEKIKVKMAVPVKGRRNFTGRLKTFQDGLLYLELDGSEAVLPWKEIHKANLVYEFEH